VHSDANVGDFVGDRSRGRYATPADSPLHGSIARAEGYTYDVGVWVVHRSRTILCRAMPNLKSYDSQRLHRCTVLRLRLCAGEPRGVSVARVSASVCTRGGGAAEGQAAVEREAAAAVLDALVAFCPTTLHSLLCGDLRAALSGSGDDPDRDGKNGLVAYLTAVERLTAAAAADESPRVAFVQQHVPMALMEVALTVQVCAAVTVARAEGYTYAATVWAVSVVQGPFFCRPAPNPNATIRNFCIAVRSSAALAGTGACSGRTVTTPPPPRWNCWRLCGWRFRSRWRHAPPTAVRHWSTSSATAALHEAARRCR
jgi:hypothetical protein